MQSLVRYSHLHEWVKQKTADLQLLPAEIAGMPPFSMLSPLATQIEEQFHKTPSLFETSSRPAWLRQLGEDLKRLDDDGQTETAEIRALATSLAATVWQTVPGLELIPYIGGVPAGTPRKAEALWQDRVLYVEDRPIAKVAKAVCHELGRAFSGRQTIADAIKFCFERSPEVVNEYMEENFKLVPRSSDVKASEPADGAESTANKSETEPQEQPPAWTSVTQSAAGTGTGTALEEFAVGDMISETEHAGEDEATPSDGATMPPRPRHAPTPAKPSMMERFALTLGFQKDGGDRFFHADGSWIGKPSGSQFWELRTASGAIVRYYWAKDHCLESEPLQIDVEVWGLIERFPDTSAFILTDIQDRPVELIGTRLRSMKEDGTIKFHPASYRVVFDAAAGG
jgi:hypothetical protein